MGCAGAMTHITDVAGLADMIRDEPVVPGIDVPQRAKVKLPTRQSRDGRQAHQPSR
jgi:hypothetical protein